MRNFRILYRRPRERSRLMKAIFLNFKTDVIFCSILCFLKALRARRVYAGEIRKLKSMHNKSEGSFEDWVFFIGILLVAISIFGIFFTIVSFRKKK